MSPVRSLFASVCAFLLVGLVGCGDDKTAPSATSQPNPPAAVNPTAAFNGPASATALDPVALDASASASADGSALKYVWDFGNGERGGGVKIAHVFATAGDNTVKLTVIDGSSRTATVSKTISISAQNATSTPVTAQILVKGIDGTPLAGVTVSPASAASTASAASGKLTVLLNAGASTNLKFSKSGYADQFLNLAVPAGAGTDGYMEVTMSTRDPALTLVDAAAGGTLTGRDGAAITLPANAFVDAAGAPVTGAVQISVTPIDVTQAGAGGFPGGFEGVQTDGTRTPIVSAGVNEFVPTVNGAPIQLAAGKTATITIPLYATRKLDGTLLAVGDTIALWSLDEATGIWIQEGSGTVVAATDSPSGLSMTAVVTHLSWWNSDLGFDPYGPKPRCEAQGGVGIPGSTDAFAAATICNMLAEIDRDLGGSGNTSTTGPAARVHASLRARTVSAATNATAKTLAFSRLYAVPIAGGTTIPVPANTDIRLTAFVLNGTWTGSTVVHGAVGAQDDVVVTLHPVGQASDTPERITLPFDGSRSVAAPSTAQFTFTASAPSVARITLSPSSGSSFAGQLRLLQGATVLGSATVANSELEQVVAYLPAAGTYTIAADIDRVAAFHLQADLEPGDDQAQPITPPFNSDRTLLPQGTATFNFNGNVGQYARIVVGAPTSFSSKTPLSGEVRLLQGSTVLRSASLSGGPTQLFVNLPSSGAYTIEITDAVGISFHLAADLEGKVQSDSLSIPTDITRSIEAGSVYQGSLILPSATTVWLHSRRISGDVTDVKLLSADGTVLFQSLPAAIESDTTNSFAATLPAGTYTVQVAPQNAQAASERLTLAATQWGTLGAPLPVSSFFQTADLVLDHDGKPVVGLLVAGAVVNQQIPYTLELRRWTGTTWEAVGTDLPLGELCGSANGVSFAFDSTNNPIVLYGTRVFADGSSYFSARRFSGGAWAPLGASDGKLPYGSVSAAACDHPTTTLVGSDNQPVVAYSSDSGAVLVHFDGTSWVGYVTRGGDLFGDYSSFFEARFDPSGALWLVRGGSQFYAQGTAQRLNLTTHAWETIGSASFPQIGTIGLQQPRLRFDSSGSPVVAWTAAVGSGGVASEGVAVYRFMGTDWTTTGGYEADSNSYGSGRTDPAFVMLNDQALVAWESTQRGQGFGTVVVQTNTPSGWTPVSGTLGQIPQYSHTDPSTADAHSPRMVTDGRAVYMTVTAYIAGTTQGQPNIGVTLLQKSAN